MRKITALLEPDVALGLWTWALAELEGLGKRDRRPAVAEVEGLLDVLTFLACELALAGRHEWITDVPRLLVLHENWLLREDSPREKCLDAVSVLLRRGAPISKTVRVMAGSRDRNVRLAVARGLPLDNPEARALLEGLRADPDRYVRKLALERLPPSEPSAWWAGKFDSDPIPRLGEADDEVIAALRTAALFIDRDRQLQQAMLPQLEQALTRLPAPILFELVRRFVVFDRIAVGYGSMLAELMRRPNGSTELWTMMAKRVPTKFDHVHVHLIVRELARQWDPALVEQLCRDLLKGLVERRHQPRLDGMAMLVESLLADLWPAGLPGALVLDAWETLAADAPALAEEIMPLLHHAKIDLRPELARLLVLAERDEKLERALSATAARLDPGARHAFVERGFASPSQAVRALALEQLGTLPPDSSQGSIDATISRFWSEPALRKAITSNIQLGEAFCPFLRRQLRAHALSLREAAATLGAIGRLWGGVADGDRRDRESAAKLEQLAAWHEGATEIGPPTEEEWVAWRTLRRRRLEEEPRTSAQLLLSVRPPGPLEPDDRAVLDQLITPWRERWSGASVLAECGNDFIMDTLHLIFGLREIDEPEVLEFFEHMLSVLRGLDEPILIDQVEPQVERLRLVLQRV